MTVSEAPASVRQTGLADQLFAHVIPAVDVVPSPEAIRFFETSLYKHDHPAYFAIPVTTRLTIRALRISQNPEIEHVGTPEERDEKNWLTAAGAEREHMFQVMEQTTHFTRSFKPKDARPGEPSLKDYTAEELDAFFQARVLPLIQKGPHVAELYYG